MNISEIMESKGYSKVSVLNKGKNAQKKSAENPVALLHRNSGLHCSDPKQEETQKAPILHRGVSIGKLRLKLDEKEI